MFPVAAAAKFSIVIRPFQSPLCAPGNLCHIVQGRAGPTSLIKALPSASWTLTNILAYILWWPVHSRIYLKYNHQCHSGVLSVWWQPAWEEEFSVEELPWSNLSVRHFLDDSWYRSAQPTVGGAIPGMWARTEEKCSWPGHGACQASSTPCGVCFRSCLQAPALTSFRDWLRFRHVSQVASLQVALVMEFITAMEGKWGHQPKTLYNDNFGRKRERHLSELLLPDVCSL